MLRFHACLLGAVLITAASSACAQAPTNHQIALREIKSGGPLKVTSPDFANGAAMPTADTQFGHNNFPGLTWSAGPSGTRSYVVLMQDSNAVVMHGPVLHWTLFNIPAETTSLRSGLTSPPAGSHYGPSYLGEVSPYAGPSPPAGMAHHYHFEVFALDQTLPAGISKGGFIAIRAAMTGHVLASGEVVGTFQR